ncbi:hypothetical protein L1987_18249 [Smallanthus sonchifolius]|uniref:Uncharacterized protein n=1 Tax=Smallanthus sonchifolius TaxID=185202 RepID=A0ACB9IZQ9_9ASTR|nr:hypothetical protein L1987_18249 [Smallanthus sonchifolius]
MIYDLIATLCILILLLYAPLFLPIGSSQQVVDRSDIREIVTAVTYNPDGKGEILKQVQGTHLYKHVTDFLSLRNQVARAHSVWVKKSV